MIKGIILDLDQTIVDTSLAEDCRRLRNWTEVYTLIPNFILYEGFNEVFTLIREKEIKCCIVTNSPNLYATRVVKYFNIPCEFIIGYHDTLKRKPNPEPMLKALQKLGIDKDCVISLGDRAIDIIASNASGIKSVACTWGSNEINELIAAKPTYVLFKPNEILGLL
jgi:phosphoglycolate phosphatase-like HAD superfamily hydrolase